MRIADIKFNDTANGEGVRVSLWLQGCARHCKGCFNESTWDYNGGRDFTQEDADKIMAELKKPEIAGLSVLGGEPIDQWWDLTLFLSQVKRRYPDKEIWMWTGYKYDELEHVPILKLIDVLVDGEFIEEQKDLRLEFRGSRNQRIIRLSEARE